MIELTDDVSRFARAVGPLVESTVANTLLGTVVDGIREGRFAEPPPRFAIVVHDGEVIGAALRTPPMPLLCSALSPADAQALVERWLEQDPELPGINAEVPTARALAASWQRLTGGFAEPTSAMALHAVSPAQLREPPRPAAGGLRVPRDDERALIRTWGRAFAVDAALPEDPDAAAESTVRLHDVGRALLWDRGDGPVSLVGHTPAVAGVPRVAPVYTPPEHRARGYASSAVHALSTRLLTAGARQVALFTDLANPTSNRIYADVGYRRIGEWELHRLVR